MTNLIHRILVLLLLLTVCVAPAVADDTVTRDLPDSADASETITVDLTVDIDTGATNYIIDEIVPSGWNVTSATGGGDYNAQAGHIMWAITSGATNIVHSYTVDVPADASGTYTFGDSSYYVFEGMSAIETILGDTDVTVGDVSVPNIVINEFVSSNGTEWVELYNNGTESVNLTGWTLEDGNSHVKSLSGTILADDYLVFSYSSWLNNGGDIIYLNDTTANIDRVAYGDWDDGNVDDNAPAPDAGKSAGRFPNGVDTDVDVDDFQIFDSLTPGMVNEVTVVTDTEAPYTSGHDPAADATGVPIGTSITVHVLDDVSGVNNSTIVMTVDGAIVTPDITGTAADYTIVYTPPAEFGYAQLVTVTVNASDLNETPNAMATDEYSFTTESATVVDDTPPYTSGHDPAADATDVPIGTSITVHVLDDVSGVNNSTIVMTVDGAIVTPDITGTAADYTIVYTPPAEFGYAQLVTVTVNASDLNETPNAMATDEYSFTTESATVVDDTPPYTSGHDPAADATDVPIGTSITVHVLDDVSGVNNSTIVMTVDGAIVTPDITGTAADYTIVYTPPAEFGYDQLVTVTVNASDLNETPNAMATDEYSFTTESDSVAEDTVTRELPDSANASETITVNLTVDVETGATNYIIDEIVPSGWNVTSATGGGDYNAQAGHIMWAITSGATDIVHSYTVEVPAGASGTYTFGDSSYYVFEGMSATTPILGDTDVTVGVSVPDIVINEFMSNNDTEWVELYNNGTESVNLTGWTLEDGNSHVKSLSGTILADDYLVFSYSSWLNNGGDIIYLNDTTANIDRVAYGDWDDGNVDDNAPAPDAGKSAGRFPNGVDTDVDVDDFQIFDSPTPGMVNEVTVVTDTEAPYTSGHDPAADATGVPIGTSITVHVLDDVSGVNNSTIVMTVDGAIVTPDITGTAADYTIVYTPPAEFGYDQLVTVTVNASDLNETPNAMATDEYSFTTESDSVAEDTVTRELPDSANASETITVNLTVDVETGATNYIIDEIVPSGWNVTSATGGGDYNAQAGHIMWAITSGATDIVHSYTVNVPADASGIYTFGDSSYYVFEGMSATAPILGDTDVKVDGVSKADTTPPNTAGHDPAQDATGVPIDTSITVHVLDAVSGVNNSTIVMTVDGEIVTPDDITGEKDDYTIVYTPPEDFGYDQLVNVTIDAADLNETPNAMATDEYSFTTESATVVDDTPPYTSGHDPAADATDVPIDTNITVHVLDDVSGVNNSTIVMTVDGAIVTPDITGTAADYTLVYDPPEDFGYEQLVNVTIAASDLNETPNVMTTDAYSFTTSAMIGTSSMDVTADPTSVVNNTATDVTFTVTSDGTSVEGALVTLLGCGVDVNDTTDENGTVTISVTATSIGTIDVTVTKDGCDDATTTITVNGAVISGNATEPVTGDFVNVTGNYTGDLTLQELGNVTGEVGTDVGLGDMIPFKGVNVTVSSLGIGEWVRIEISYTDEELNEHGIDETTLEMYKFNETAGEWELVRVQSYCLDNGKGDHHLWVEVDHLCKFISAGKTTAPPATPPSGGSSGGSGTYPPGWDQPAPTPAATPAPTTAAPEPTVAPTDAAPTEAPTDGASTVATTEAPTETPTTKLPTKGTPGFGATLTVFVIAGLLVATYLVMRRRE